MLVLASQSPRRSEILRQAGIPFLVQPANVDESQLAGEDPEAYVERLAEAKALAAPAGPEDLVLGADTAVVIDGQTLGKPVDTADAVRMLQLLSGRWHQVITGICIKSPQGLIRDRSVTGVWFAELLPDEIQEYVASGEPMDKAGAYAIQGLASKFVCRIDGCYWNVVGLPVVLVYQHLRRLQR